MIKRYFREPVSSLTHLSGAVLALIGTIILFINTSIFTPAVVCSILIFGISMIALYATSGIYHLVRAKDVIIEKLRKLDHSMIFVLIAGSYTPFCLLVLDGFWQWGILTLIWALAILGITLKMFWMNMPRVLSTAFYIGMGWLALIVIKPLHVALAPQAFFLLVLGGVMYTIGGVIYALKLPNFSEEFGFHELFHIFVMLGSLCHYLIVLNFLL